MSLGRFQAFYASCVEKAKFTRDLLLPFRMSFCSPRPQKVSLSNANRASKREIKSKPSIRLIINAENICAIKKHIEFERNQEKKYIHLRAHFSREIIEFTWKNPFRLPHCRDSFASRNSNLAKIDIALKKKDFFREFYFLLRNLIGQQKKKFTLALIINNTLNNNGMEH